MAFTSVSHNSLIDQVTQQLQSMIERGELTSQEEFPTETELAREMDVGRSTVREALARLEANGLIDRSRSRPRVIPDAQARLAETHVLRRIRNQTVDRLYEARAALETIGAELAAGRRTEADIAQLSQDILQQESALSTDPEQALAADFAFHRHVMAASKNPILVDLHELLLIRFQASYSDFAFIPRLTQMSIDHHRQILERIHRQDAEGAATLTRRTILRVQEYVKSVVGQEEDPNGE